MLNPKFGDKPGILNSLVRNILKVDPENLPGDIPGVALTKLRSSLIDEPTLFLGISSSGINKKGTSCFFAVISQNYSLSEKSKAIG